MKREIFVFGIILLLIGLAISPSIYANKEKKSIEIKSLKNSSIEEDVDLIRELLISTTTSKNHFELTEIRVNFNNNIDLKHRLVSIIVDNDRFKNIFYELKNSDCDCINEVPLEWNFPIFCFMLLFIYIAAFAFMAFTMIELPFMLTAMLANIANCFWFN